MITLDLVRHGEAERLSAGRDAGRALTDDGRASIQALGSALLAQPGRPALILASPLLRARQTAALLAEALAADSAPPPIEVTFAVVPEAEPDDVVTELRVRSEAARHILVVSHMPLVARLFLHLTGDTTHFHTGALRRVTFAQDMAPRSGARALEL